MTKIAVEDIRLQLDPDSIKEAKHGKRRRQISKLMRYRAFVGDREIGYVEKAMQTFENRTPGRVWVNYRWESPRWKVHLDGESYSRSYYETRKAGVEALVWWFNARVDREAQSISENSA